MELGATEYEFVMKSSGYSFCFIQCTTSWTIGKTRVLKSHNVPLWKNSFNSGTLSFLGTLMPVINSMVLFVVRCRIYYVMTVIIKIVGFIILKITFIINFSFIMNSHQHHLSTSTADLFDFFMATSSQTKVNK